MAQPIPNTKADYPRALQGLTLLRPGLKVGLNFKSWVRIVAQQVKNPTSIHEDTGLIPGLTQWVKDLALPRAVV